MSDNYYVIFKNQIKYLYEDMLKSTIVHINYYLMIKLDYYIKGMHTNIPLIKGMSHLKSIMQPKVLDSEVTCTLINNKNACHILNNYITTNDKKIDCKDTKELKNVYKSLMLKYHPDKTPHQDKNSSEHRINDFNFRAVQSAYEFIKKNHEATCDIQGKIQSYLLYYYDNDNILFRSGLKDYCDNTKDGILCGEAFNSIVEEL